MKAAATTTPGPNLKSRRRTIALPFSVDRKRLRDLAPSRNPPSNDSGDERLSPGTLTGTDRFV
jgi:hypothetical protein